MTKKELQDQSHEGLYYYNDMGETGLGEGIWGDIREIPEPIEWYHSNRNKIEGKK